MIDISYVLVIAMQLHRTAYPEPVHCKSDPGHFFVSTPVPKSSSIEADHFAAASNFYVGDVTPMFLWLLGTKVVRRTSQTVAPLQNNHCVGITLRNPP
jgi:hypothetical protein